MSEIVYSTLPLLGLGYSLDLAGKGHPIAKRVFETYDDLQSYVNNQKSSAVSGIILVALKGDDKGAYLVEQIKGDQGFTETKITKIALGEIQILSVSEDSSDEVKIEDNQLTVPDMRSYWENNSF